MSGLSEEELYRKLHTGNEGDSDFYARAAKGAKSILEIGCGWGRLSKDWAQDGYKVTGIDTNEHFIELARKSVPNADFFIADARDFTLDHIDPPLFDRVFIPYNTLYALEGAEGVSACLQSAKRHLSAKGEIWMDVYPADDFHQALLNGEELPEDDDEPVGRFPHEGGEAIVLESTDFEPESKLLRVHYRAQLNGAPIGELKMRHHYLLIEELLEILRQEDLDVLSIFTRFDGEVNEEEAEQLIIGCGHLGD